MEPPLPLDNYSYSINQFDYQLPIEKIAVNPLEERDQSKLLVFKNGAIEDSIYSSISNYIKENSTLIFNQTKVVQARLLFKNSNGGKVEIFCLEPADLSKEVHQSMQQTSDSIWKCFVGDVKKWREEWIAMEFDDLSGTLFARKVTKSTDAYIIEFKWEPSNLTFGEVLEKAGKVPLPPYIKRDSSPEDKTRYQTIYAQNQGSVAAPTAGLHYTPAVFDNLNKKGITPLYITLHVGAGTFKPIKTEQVTDHEMHSEQIVVERSFIEDILQRFNSDIVAVGTTSLRTIESLYWLGLKIYLDQNSELYVKQWDPYSLKPVLTASQSLEVLLKYLNDNKYERLLARTQLMILPGYEWKIVNVLATNFHQPKSTLILLVAAFIGDDWKKVYNHALNNNYRFLSYGDGSLLFR